MKTSLLLPIGFILVGILCIYPWFVGKDSASDFKILAGLILLLFGIGNLIFELVKRK